MDKPTIEVSFKKRTGKGGKTFTQAYYREARPDGTYSRLIQVDTETAKKMLREQSFDGGGATVVERA